ncbi:transcription-repair coupling factor [Saxibacter everestensis]|uniref:Transcription-repair-coupling factor n=1 Tax=Saxibacter everestensis TaxID=2909229 RepID=A0ABY8QR93_9MICO|nr:transcription-repair coupling factor [Brevibacteriaceae bacterium ZFBP1038]
MTLRGVLEVLPRDDAFAAARRGLADGAANGTVSAVPGVWPAVISAWSEDNPQLIVTATGREADDVAAALGQYLDPAGIAIFPSWETLPHERLSPRSDTVGRRLSVLRRLRHPESHQAPLRVVVAPVRAVLQPLVKGLGELEPVSLKIGDERSLTDVAEALANAAYARVDMVERRGEFAIRGGILDIFPPTEPHPLRIEFFGDEVDDIREFSVADQRSLDSAPPSVLWAPPCREILLTDAVRQRAADLLDKFPAAAEMLERLSAGIAVEGMESLAPALVDGMEPFLATLPQGTRVVVLQPEKVKARAADLVSTSEEFLAAAWSGASAGGKAPIDLSSASYRTLADTEAAAGVLGLPWWTLGGFAVDEELVDEEAPSAFSIGVREVRSYRGEVEQALVDLKNLTHDKWQTLVVTEGHGPADRLMEVLSEADVPARRVENIDDAPEPGVVLVTTGATTGGFIAEDLRLAFLTEADVLGKASAVSTKDMRRLPSRRRKMVDPLQLSPGDHVVHEQHGVGRFVEMTQRTVGSGQTKHTREYLVIEYASSKRGQPGDRLYVPSDSLDQVTRYVGGESPTLSKMGGSDWSRTKSRARKAVKEIAGELIRLYSARQATQGHAFGPDTPWQRDLEDAFNYIETPDQLTTIDEVKADMEKTVPMDRLICGDVGYGKTEIAVRAAFKAVQDGKQVAVLVPTTLLVQQHFDTFSERYSGFPITVGSLSRFQTESASKAVKEELTSGALDIVIGTHRLLSGEVRFKDLGLVVVDEEQRFGVEHKETLKALRTNVDVLSMSATPIPRTLEMAVTGIREMSTLATPPEERHPVLTYVGAYDEKQVTAAIRRELLREGQVFFIHNRVQSIEAAAKHLNELVPEARIGVAHGKMNEQRLEQMIVDFWERKFDVLVCTTIVETGIDISNANTLIIDRSDRLGLSQLHQLRGRVGRGRERAYAYFLYPPESELTETAHDRLQTLAAHTELGAGMQVAMKDLEIRGAGNLLGGEQSGHIEGVGFDLYIRLVGEAVANFRGDVPEPEQEVRIELPINAHLPHEYVPHERLRLEAYRKLADAGEDKAVQEVLDELVDRYGPIPEPVANLAAVARFRVHARKAGLSDIVAQGNFVRMAPVELRDSQAMRLKRLYPKTLIKPAVRSILVPKPKQRGSGLAQTDLYDIELLDWARDLIDGVLLDDVSAAATTGTSGARTARSSGSLD